MNFSIHGYFLVASLDESFLHLKFPLIYTWPVQSKAQIVSLDNWRNLIWAQNSNPIILNSRQLSEGVQHRRWQGLPLPIQIPRQNVRLRFPWWRCTDHKDDWLWVILFQLGMTNAQLLDRGGHGKQKPIPGPGSSSCVMVNLCSLNRNGYAVNLYIWYSSSPRCATSKTPLGFPLTWAECDTNTNCNWFHHHQSTTSNKPIFSQQTSSQVHDIRIRQETIKLDEYVAKYCWAQ